MSILTKDRAFALAVLALVAVLGVASLDIPTATSWQTYGSAFYPQVLLGIIGVLALLLLVRSFQPRSARQSPLIPELVGFVRTNLRIVALFLVFAIYVAAMPIIGYLAATVGFLALSFLLLSGFATRRAAVVSVVLVLVVPLVIVFVFENILGIRLP